MEYGKNSPRVTNKTKLNLKNKLLENLKNQMKNNKNMSRENFSFERLNLQQWITVSSWDIFKMEFFSQEEWNVAVSCLMMDMKN